MPAVASLLVAALCFVLFGGCTLPSQSNVDTTTGKHTVDIAAVPDYSGEAYIELNGGVPTFTEEEMNVADGTEVYGSLDRLGRATFAFAKICELTRPPKGSQRSKDMPDPTGFVQAKYPQIGTDHLYERSHLIAYSFTDEAANPNDLITGTEYMNRETMGIFEGYIREYLNLSSKIDGHGAHVLMRVTPDFRGNELVARGVQIEALSLGDNGDAIKLNVYCYNVQPDVEIDYSTGKSRLARN